MDLQGLTGAGSSSGQPTDHGAGGGGGHHSDGTTQDSHGEDAVSVSAEPQLDLLSTVSHLGGGEMPAVDAAVSDPNGAVLGVLALLREQLDDETLPQGQHGVSGYCCARHCLQMATVADSGVLLREIFAAASRFADEARRLGVQMGVAMGSARGQVQRDSGNMTMKSEPKRAKNATRKLADIGENRPETRATNRRLFLLEKGALLRDAPHNFCSGAMQRTLCVTPFEFRFSKVLGAGEYLIDILGMRRLRRRGTRTERGLLPLDGNATAQSLAGGAGESKGGGGVGGGEGAATRSGVGGRAEGGGSGEGGGAAEPDDVAECCEFSCWRDVPYRAKKDCWDRWVACGGRTTAERGLLILFMWDRAAGRSTALCNEYFTRLLGCSTARLVDMRVLLQEHEGVLEPEFLMHGNAGRVPANATSADTIEKLRRVVDIFTRTNPSDDVLVCIGEPKFQGVAGLVLAMAEECPEAAALSESTRRRIVERYVSQCQLHCVISVLFQVYACENASTLS